VRLVIGLRLLDGEGIAIVRGNLARDIIEREIPEILTNGAVDSGEKRDY